MRGLSAIDIKELIEEQFPIAKVEAHKYSLIITINKDKPRLMKYLDNLVIPNYISVEVK